jgi:hypothetical protein
VKAPDDLPARRGVDHKKLSHPVDKFDQQIFNVDVGEWRIGHGFDPAQSVVIGARCVTDISMRPPQVSDRGVARCGAISSSWTPAPCLRKRTRGSCWP